MHILAIIHKQQFLYIWLEQIVLSVPVCVCNLSSCCPEKYPWMSRKKYLYLLKFANDCQAFFCNETPLFSFLSLAHCSVFLRSRRTCLALINVSGIRLALHLFFSTQPLTASSHILPVPPSQLKIQQASTVISTWVITHSHTHSHINTLEEFGSILFFVPSTTLPILNPCSPLNNDVLIGQ